MKYQVTIEESFSKTFEVNANSPEEAEKLVFVINKYALAGYADEEAKKYMINVEKK